MMKFFYLIVKRFKVVFALVVFAWGIAKIPTVILEIPVVFSKWPPIVDFFKEYIPFNSYHILAVFSFIWALVATILLALKKMPSWESAAPVLIESTQFIFKKDHRIAAIEKYAKDPLINKFKAAVLASRVLHTTNWSVDALKSTPKIKRIQGDDPHNYQDQWFDFFKRCGVPGDRVNELLNRLGGCEPGLQKIYISQIQNAKQAVYLQRASWGRYEASIWFPTEEIRNKWHELRVENDKVNSILLEIKGRVKQAAEKWPRDFDPEIQSVLIKELELGQCPVDDPFKSLVTLDCATPTQ